jgi:hypothetical protein
MIAGSYIHLVPFDVGNGCLFLKTIVPAGRRSEITMYRKAMNLKPDKADIENTTS